MSETSVWPILTIVMPVYNEERFLEQTILQLLSQEYPKDRYEILVVDGMSEDRTPTIVKALAEKHGNIHLHLNPKRRSSAGRNVGFKAGRGEYFVVVDGHCYIPDTLFFKNVAEAFEKSGADCLGRPQPLDPPGLTVFQQAVALARKSRLGHGSDSLVYGEYEGYASPVSNGAVYARHVFEKVGYVDEDFDACEDVEFNYRIENVGLRCYTSPKLTVKYYPRDDLKGLFRQMVRYGVGRRRFTKKHPAALTLNQLVPVGFVCGLIILAAMAFMAALADSYFPVASVLALAYGFYLTLVAGESLRIAAHHGGCYFQWLPVVFALVHCGLGSGFLYERIREVMRKSSRKANGV